MKNGHVHSLGRQNALRGLKYHEVFIHRATYTSLGVNGSLESESLHFHFIASFYMKHAPRLLTSFISLYRLPQIAIRPSLVATCRHSTLVGGYVTRRSLGSHTLDGQWCQWSYGLNFKRRRKVARYVNIGYGGIGIVSQYNHM